MKPDFSEFSYGYAVTEELVASLKASVVAAPVFPSLYDEGKSGGGYDVKIPLTGKPIFLQFKLSDHLERANSKEHRSGLLPVPYYRMYLRPTNHSDQHELLRDLEAAGQSVFYIAPEFHLPAELNDFYLNKSVIAHSAAFSPQDIGQLPDGEEHYVVFEPGAAVGYRCSDEPQQVRKTPLSEGFEFLLRSRDVPSRHLGEEGLRAIASQLLAILSENEERLWRRQKSIDIEGIRRIAVERPPVESIGYMARTFFDAELLVVPS